VSVKEKIRDFLQECGYTMTSLRPEGDLFRCRKKKDIKVAVIEKWTREDLKKAIDCLLEKQEEEVCYRVVVTPGNEVNSESLQPIEVIAHYYYFCNENGINIWGMDNESGDLFLVTGSLPQFDFKILSKLMKNKSMLGAGAQKVIESRVRNFLVRGFHSWEEFDAFSGKNPEEASPDE
jgi:hypothetical protein